MNNSNAQQLKCAALTLPTVASIKLLHFKFKMPMALYAEAG